MHTAIIFALCGYNLSPQHRKGDLKIHSVLFTSHTGQWVMFNREISDSLIWGPLKAFTASPILQTRKDAFAHPSYSHFVRQSFCLWKLGRPKQVFKQMPI
ncbi:hypothetical protein GDO86_018644 [Hymenochirus boettgeri]|uniref:Uncharacterized protein n=1 Tax=Hymenochirus boettgeri TaxID=247094 RepID=A0A8T2IHK2_9PIPI|nr:hypothetical protein GDO86_018644 [Hymenochirus boettgeri]